MNRALWMASLLRPKGGGGPPPVASFTYVASNLQVTFTDTSTNTPTSWLWDFGDGNTSTSQNPVHNYAGHGSYTVTVTATNAGGSDESAPQVIAVNTALHAELIALAPSYAFDMQQVSGASEPNIGVAGIDGTINGVVLGQTDSIGTNDAYLFDGISDSIIIPANFTWGRLTLVMLIKPQGTLAAGNLFMALGASLNKFTLKTVGDGSAIEWVYSNSAGTRVLTMTTNTGVLVSGQMTAIICRYTSTTGVAQLQYSDDGTIKTPTYSLDNSPQTAISGGTLLTPTIYSGNVGGSGTVVSAFLLSAPNAIVYSDAQLLALLATIPSWS